MRYSVVLTVAAAEDFRRLDGSLKEPVAKQLRKLETAPRLGEHLGNRAGLDLTGYYKTLRSEEIDPYRVPDHRPRDPGRSRRDWKARRSRGLSGSPQAVKTPGSIGELFLCVLMKQLRSPSWPSDSKRGFTTEESTQVFVLDQPQKQNERGCLTCEVGKVFENVFFAHS